MNWQETGHEHVGDRGDPCALCGARVGKAIHSKSLHARLELPYISPPKERKAV